MQLAHRQRQPGRTDKTATGLQAMELRAQCAGILLPAGGDHRIVGGAQFAQEQPAQGIQVRLLGACEGVEEQYYAISTERRVAHPLVQQLLNARAMLS